MPSRTEDGTAYDDWPASTGQGTAPAIVLIHGLGLSRHLWASHLKALTGTHRVINYDLYGHGESAPPPEEASLRVYAEQIARLLDELGVEDAAIVGFSIGGMINRRFVLDHPDRASSLVILNSPHDRGDEGQRAVEERASTVRSQGALATMDAALARWFTPEYLASEGLGPALVRQWRMEADAESYAQAAWVLAAGVRELTSPELIFDLPALVMTGEGDTGSTPAMAHAIAAQFRGEARATAQTLIVPRLQHLGLLEQPELFTNPILDFLDRSVS